MYTDITTEKAIKTFETLFNSPQIDIPPDFPRTLFLQILEIIMNNNILVFHDTYWLQKHGNAMGTPEACLYATIAYGIHEKLRILAHFTKN
jgi:hypothetical protein